MSEMGVMSGALGKYEPAARASGFECVSNVLCGGRRSCTRMGDGPGSSSGLGMSSILARREWAECRNPRQHWNFPTPQ